jgi:methylmalonyl-CoA epimerase
MSESAPVGGVRRVHHVAVAVNDLEESLRFYQDVLGLSGIHIVEVPEQGLRVALVKIGDVEMELLQPTTPDGTVRRFIDRRGQGMHHVCFQVDDVRAAMEELKSRGAQFVDPVPRPGVGGMVAFMTPATASGMLVELLEPEAST